MALDLDLLKQLSEVAAIPGWEDRARELVSAELEELVDDARTDAMGSLIAHKAGKGPRVMLAAHLDEIGFYVKHVDDKGFLRVQNVGGFDTRNLFARQVTVHAASGDLPGLMNPSGKPVHISTADERKKVPEMGDFFVDLGLTPARVNKLVRIGDPVTLRQQAGPMGELFTGKAMDDRAAVFVLIETLRRLRGKRSRFDLFAVFTAQEEVGLRGACTSAFGVQPDIGVAVDVTLAVDVPEVSPSLAITRLGKGVAIKIMDSASISNRKLVREFTGLAQKKKIPHQLEVLPQGGTDAGAIQRSRAGVPTVTVSVPTRYVHTITEAVHTADLQAAINLLVAWLL